MNIHGHSMHSISVRCKYLTHFKACCYNKQPQIQGFPFTDDITKTALNYS